jgi:hypothetical protein
MSLLQDLRFAIRLLVKGRWFTLVAAAALALGIAANSAVFTLVNAVLLRGVPFKDPEQIVALGTRDTRNRNLGVSFLDFQDWRVAARSFSDMSLFGQPPLNVSEEARRSATPGRSCPPARSGCWACPPSSAVRSQMPRTSRVLRPA